MKTRVFMCIAVGASIYLFLWATVNRHANNKLEEKDSELIKVVSHTSSASESFTKYEPTWDSLDSRPLPPWYDEAKIGIFLHWGVFSVPSFGSEWFWYNWNGTSAIGKKKAIEYEQFMDKNYPPGFTYQDFGPKFTAEFYDPDQWAKLFSAAGAKYIVLTSKHHEGFTLWPSKHSWGWNAMDVGPHRDLLGDLARSIRSKTPDIHFGLYHSLYDWFNPLYLQDKRNNFKTSKFIQEKTMPELYELVNNYQPDIVWSDGDWAAEDTYWTSKDFLAWLFNDSPVKDTVVVNDRWGKGVKCKHGSFYTCHDRYNPGLLLPHKWENCMTIDKNSWGYRRDAVLSEYLTIHELLKTLVETISCGGNLLVNVGPTHDGRIPPIMEERLRQMGEWLTINGEAVYKSKPWIYQKDTYTPDVWFTQSPSKSVVYALVVKWPKGSLLLLGSILSSEKSTIEMIGYPKPLLFKTSTRGTEIVFPPMSLIKTKWIFVIRMTNVNGKDRLYI